MPGVLEPLSTLLYKPDCPGIGDLPVVQEIGGWCSVHIFKSCPEATWKLTAVFHWPPHFQPSVPVLLLKYPQLGKNRTQSISKTCYRIEALAKCFPPKRNLSLSVTLLRTFQSSWCTQPHQDRVLSDHQL